MFRLSINPITAINKNMSPALTTAQMNPLALFLYAERYPPTPLPTAKAILESGDAILRFIFNRSITAAKISKKTNVAKAPMADEI